MIKLKSHIQVRQHLPVVRETRQGETRTSSPTLFFKIGNLV